MIHHLGLGLFLQRLTIGIWRDCIERERVRACLTCTPFDYLVRPYRMSLANYFIGGSEVHPHMRDFVVVTDIEGVDELQHQFHHL